MTEETKKIFADCCIDDRNAGGWFYFIGLFTDRIPIYNI